jgi:hypothetical protein
MNPNREDSVRGVICDRLCMQPADLTEYSLRETAARPDLRPAVYWFWSEIPDRESSAAQLTEIASAGFSTVLIQTRLGFAREQYLTAEYLDAYRTAVLQAKELGLKVGVYDEYAWISGHGGGRTVLGADHLRERCLFWSTSSAGATQEAHVSDIESWWVDGFGGPEKQWLYDDALRRWDQWELVAALAHPSGAADPEGCEAASIDVTASVTVSGRDDGCTITLDAARTLPPDWVVTAFVSARCASSRMVNYLDPATAERFIEVAYEPYAEALQGLLGDPVEFFSFDHPYGGFYEWPQGKAAQIGNALMWDHEMTAHVASIDQRPLAQTLHQIVHGRNDEAKQTRVEFFRRYSERGIESFFGTLRRWADAHNVGLSGHELLAHVGGWDLNGAFPEVDARTNFGLDYFSVDRQRTRTLVDASNFNMQISPKFGDSVARAHGRSRCIVEQYAARNDGPGHYAAGYWELRLDELRLQTLRHHLLGARQLIFHAYGQSDGSGENSDVLTNPRFDFPPTCNFEPWFKHFRAYAEESANVSAFIEAAEPVHGVALVYPLHTVWAEGPTHRHAALIGQWAELLAASGIGFDLVDDRELAAATVADGQISLQVHKYSSVILAGATTLPSARCLEVLDELSAQGGTAIVTDTVPEQAPPELKSDAVFTVLARAGAGTLWTWQGRSPESARLVLVNDGLDTRKLTIMVADQPVTALTLGPEELACLQLGPDGITRFSASPAAPTALGPALLRIDQGWTFNAGEQSQEAPIEVDRGWEQQDFPSFGGEGIYRTEFDFKAAGGDPLVLELPEVHCAVSAELNGVELGARGWRPFRFAIPPGILNVEGNQLTLRVTNTAANRYYAGTPFQAGLQPSGITAAPILRTQNTEECK